MPQPQRLVALDTGVLLAVEAGAGDCLTCFQVLGRAGYVFCVTPLILQELEKAERNHSRELSQALASNLLAPGALQGLGIISPSMTETEREVTAIHAARLVEKDILSGAANEDDLIALIEAAYLDCTLFITCTDGLLNRRDEIELALIRACGMRSLILASPPEIIRAFNGPP